MVKVALVTGSAVRIGREIAIHLAESGWDLALHYSSSKREVLSLKSELALKFPNLRLEIFQANLLDIVQTENLVKSVINRFGLLDLLINNASVFEPSSLKKTTSELLMKHSMINYIAPFILMRDFARQQDKGQIINILDTRITTNKSDYLAYSLSKKTLFELSKMSALELAPNFRVNAIAPGAVLPPPGKDQIYLDQIACKTPMKIPSGTSSIMKTIDYIIDNKDITGQTIYCDGGSHLM
ncbi:MAG: SDR family NAD(P)-dependent oxidoreductase [Mariniphaga sp.]